MGMNPKTPRGCRRPFGRVGWVLYRFLRMAEHEQRAGQTLLRAAPDGAEPDVAELADREHAAACSLGKAQVVSSSLKSPALQSDQIDGSNTAPPLMTR